jgi:hypothetical protein
MASVTEQFGPNLDKLAYLRVSDVYALATASINRIRWTYWPRNHPVSNLVIGAFSAFGSLPNLRELTILVVVTYPFPGFNFKPFSNLFSLSITWQLKLNVNEEFIRDVADLLGRCPDLECLTFCIPRPYYPPDAPLLAHILANLPSTTCLKLRLLDVTGLRISANDFRLHLHHLLYLRILRLMLNRQSDSPQQNSQICQLLLDKSIHLDELTIDTTHPTSVLDYLSSYSGLHHLEFRSRHPGADTPEGVHRFFSSVIPLHSATLRELYLGWSVDTLWTRLISPDDVAQIKQCQQLTSLCCYVTVSLTPTECTDKVLVSNVYVYSSISAYHYAKRMWLEISMQLPQLQYLALLITCRYQPPLRNGHYYYDLATIRERKIEKAMEGFAQAAVDMFTADIHVPFQIMIASPTNGP